jgi:hypothetical protein
MSLAGIAPMPLMAVIWPVMAAVSVAMLAAMLVVDAGTFVARWPPEPGADNPSPHRADAQPVLTSAGFHTAIFHIARFHTFVLNGVKSVPVS